MITMKIQFPYMITKMLPIVFGMSFEGYLSEAVID